MRSIVFVCVCVYKTTLPFEKCQTGILLFIAKASNDNIAIISIPSKSNFTSVNEWNSRYLKIKWNWKVSSNGNFSNNLGINCTNINWKCNLCRYNIIYTSRKTELIAFNLDNCDYKYWYICWQTPVTKFITHNMELGWRLLDLYPLINV